jgi:hypothetical protein
VDADGASGSATVLPNMHEMIDVGSQRFSQTAIVPEPSAIALLGTVALIFPIAFRRRGCRLAE